MPHLTTAQRTRAALIAVTLMLALAACSRAFGPEENLCGRLVRFHLGLYHPVEVVDSDGAAGKLHVRIAYLGTRQERSSVEGAALCRFTDQKGDLEVIGAVVDGDRLENGALRAFNRFVQARKRAAG